MCFQVKLGDIFYFIQYLDESITTPFLNVSVNYNKFSKIKHTDFFYYI